MKTRPPHLPELIPFTSADWLAGWLRFPGNIGEAVLGHCCLALGVAERLPVAAELCQGHPSHGIPGMPLAALHRLWWRT